MESSSTYPKLHYGDLLTDKYVGKRLEKYVRLMTPKLQEKGVEILEIGCYTANILNYLPKGVNYYGIDFDTDALKIAAQQGARVINIHFDREEIILEKQFDIILCTEVLEHLVDPKRMLAKIYSLLKEDGIAVISLPNENTIYHRIMSLLGKGVDMCAFDLYKHLHLPTIQQNENFLRQYFKIEKRDYYINPSAKKSRSEWLGSILTLVPDAIWEGLARVLPGLFARGVIFSCTKSRLTESSPG